MPTLGSPRKSQARRKSQAATIGSFLERDDWMRAILASDLPHITVRVGIRIALHLNVESGRCNPSFPTLAAESRVSERSTYRLVDQLDHSGWIAVTRISGSVNQYTLLTPDRVMAGVRPPTPDRIMAGGTPAKSRGDPCQNRPPPLTKFWQGTPDTAGRGKANLTAKRTAGKETLSAAPDLFVGEKEEATEEEKKISGRAADDGGEAFDAFWAVYPRRVAPQAARKAFERAVKGVHNADILIEGAKRYAVERRGQDPKFTKHPATWLNGGCWEDELPGAVIDQEGNVVAVEKPPPKRSGPKTWAEVREEFDAEMEARDGHIH